jgi:hypothetical protein
MQLLRSMVTDPPHATVALRVGQTLEGLPAANAIEGQSRLAASSQANSPKRTERPPRRRMRSLESMCIYFFPGNPSACRGAVASTIERVPYLRFQRKP